MYCIGTLLSMQIPFVGFQPVQSSEHMAAFGVFGLCQLYALNEYIRSKLSKEFYNILFKSLVVFIGIVSLAAIIILTLIGSNCFLLTFNCSQLIHFHFRNIPLDWKILFSFGPILCQKQYSYNRICF